MHISKLKKIPGNIFVDILKVRNLSRRVFFGRIKLSSKPEKRPAGAFWADKIVFWAEKSSRRGLLSGSNCNFSQKVVPQDSFGWIKLYFELEKRLAGAFWADRIVF